ncbi:hypothetical protein Dimus_022519, partial [Dionaea muscipula]
MDFSDIIRKRLEWMQAHDRLSALYVNWVKEFLQLAFSRSDEEVIPRSRNKCNNCIHKNLEEIEVNSVLNGIVKGYVRWTYHGECPSEQPYYNRKEPIKVVDDGPDDINACDTHPRLDYADKLFNLVKDAEQNCIPV